MVVSKEQGVVRDERGQDQPKDKKRAQQSQMEGPAAYAPHEDEPTSAGEVQKHPKKKRQSK